MMLAPNNRFETPPLLLTCPGSKAITGCPPGPDGIPPPPPDVEVGGMPPPPGPGGGAGRGPVGCLSGPVGGFPGRGPVGCFPESGPVFFLAGLPYSGRKAPSRPAPTHL